MVVGPNWHAPNFEGQKGRSVSADFKVVDETLVHDGGFFALFETTIEDGSGSHHKRAVLRHPGAVAVVALDADNNVYLVKQYRTPLDADIIEIPAGKLDIDAEKAVDAARRELLEEVGLSAASVEPLLNVHHTPGILDEYCQIFLATELSEDNAAPEGPEELAMRVIKVPLAESAEMCLKGEISDSKTVSALLAVTHQQQ